jgi:hypothetical protein
MTCLIVCSATVLAQDQSPNDGLYREIIRTVLEADFDGMAATYHPDAVLVSRERTTAISEQMPRWREAGEAFANAGGRATVAFRFSSRVSGDASAFDAGIFRYAQITAEGEETASYLFFENLSVKKNGRWLTMMERQKELASEADWKALASWE